MASEFYEFLGPDPAAFVEDIRRMLKNRHDIQTEVVDPVPANPAPRGPAPGGPAPAGQFVMMEYPIIVKTAADAYLFAMMRDAGKETLSCPHCGHPVSVTLDKA